MKRAQVALGAYIQYLDSDDYLLPNKFSDQIAALEAHPECSIAYGTSSHVHADGRVFADPSRHTANKLIHYFRYCLLRGGGILILLLPPLDQ